MGTNITKIAPYVYLAKRSNNETIYDLYLLVPVDSHKTVDLSKVQPVKTPGTRIFIPYPSEPSAPTPPPTPNNPPPPSSGSTSASPYKFKHWEIDSEGEYLDIHIQCDSNEDLTTIIKFADADIEPATSLNDWHTLAPYLFVGKETGKEPPYFRPSCIVLFDENTEVVNEEWAFYPGGSEYTIELGDGGISVLSPQRFTANQGVSHKISDDVYALEGIVSGVLGKPMRRGKIKNTRASSPLGSIGTKAV